MNQNPKISLKNFILYTSVFTEIIPVIFYLVRSKNEDKRLRVIFFLLIINFITDLYGLYSISKLKTNFVSFNIYLLIETIALYFFYKAILANPVVKKILSAIISVFVVFWIYEFFRAGQTNFLYYCATFENIFILVLAIYFYYEKIFLLNEAFIYTNSKFWIVSAFFIYTAGTFFLLLYIPSLNSKGQLKIYILNYIFVIIKTLLLSIAMLMKNNNVQQPKFKIT